jgi:hypothetical protein
MLRFRSHASFLCALASAIAAVSLDTGEARACGGCFHQPAPPPAPSQVVVDTVVTDHRMAFSLSPAQTVLWDQIRYTGNPSEFAWVLPVRAGARVELAQDAWLASLEASTQTVIIGPSSNCAGPPTEYENGGGGGGGCGASFGAESSASGFATTGDDDAGAASTPQVQVLSEEVVGPYEVVTVQASQGEALGSWLDANGFELPLALQPTVDAFTMAGFDFLALKLRPGVGVQAMQPVRVVTPGADPTLPLRMIAAGVGANVSVELFVLSEGRYHPQNFPDATVDFSQLAWNPTLNESTYTTLAQQALAANGGTGWLTEFAGPADLSTFSSGPNPSLASAYASQCTPAPASCTTLPSAMGQAGDDDASAADANAIDATVNGADASFADARADAIADAAAEANTGADASIASDGGEGDGSDSDGSVTVCSAAVMCDDLQIAMTGIASGNLWVTRLRANLPVGALAADLVLEAASSQVPVPNVHNATTYTIPGYNPCPASATGTSATSASAAPASGSGGGCACLAAEASRTPPAGTIAFALAIAGFVFAASRRRRR